MTAELGGRPVLDEPLPEAADAPRSFGFSAAGDRPGAVRVVSVTPAGRPPATVPLLPGRDDGRFDSRFRSDFPLGDRTFFLGRPYWASAALPDRAVVEYEFFHDLGRSAVWPVVGGETVRPADPATLPAFAWVKVRVEVRGAEAVVAFDGRPVPARKVGPVGGLSLTLADGAASGTVRGAKLTADRPSPTRLSGWFPVTPAPQ